MELKTLKIIVPLKYLSNSWRNLECELNMKLQKNLKTLKLN